MNKRVEGTFAEYEDLKETINTMLGQGFAAKQLLVVTRNEEGRRLVEETSIDVVVTSEHDESLWTKIKSFFTVELDDDDDDDEDVEEVDEEDIFEAYGIDEDMYERFEVALGNGEYLLLVDDAPPEQQEHSQFLVRDGIIPKEEDSVNYDKTPKSAKPDWASSDDKVNGDVEKHSMDAAKGKGAAQHQAAHPDPKPGVTEQDNVQAEIPQSQHPDPLVDNEGKEIPMDPEMMETVGSSTPKKNSTVEGKHHGAHPDPVPGETEDDNVTYEIPQSDHPDPLVDDDGNEMEIESDGEHVVGSRKGHDGHDDVTEIPRSGQPTPVVYDEDDNKYDEAPTSPKENPDLEEDTTGEPIEAADPHGDPTMADQNLALEPMQFDEGESHPEKDDRGAHISRDPFGGDTVEGEEANDVDPEYEDSDRKPPAL